VTQAQALSDLGLGGIFGASIVGRPKKQVSFALGAELTERDAEILRETQKEPITLVHIRRSHHELAKLIASGLKMVEVAEITGYTPNRIAILKADPQFSELVRHYTEIEDQAHLASRADFHQRLANLGFDSMEVLHQRLLDEPDSFSATEVLKILEATADRTGYGKTSTQNLNIQSVTLSASELKDIRDGAYSSAPDPAREVHRESLLRLAVRATESLPAGEAVSGGEGEGSGVREEGGEAAQGDLWRDPDVPSVD
jgi:hypothetical protein